MLYNVPLKSRLAWLLCHKLVILAGLIAGSFQLSVYSVSANEPIAQPNISISADNVAGEAGLNGGIFTVVRTGSTASPLKVEYTVAGTGIAGEDYEELSGSIDIPAGASSGTIALTPLDDEEVEGSETVIITLNSKATYRLKAPTGATITIADDDTAEQLVSFSISDPEAAEAGIEAGRIMLTRNGSTATPLVVNYSLGGTAISGEDYIALAGSANIPAGASSITIALIPLDDQVVEGAEIVVLTLTPDPDYMIAAPSSATIAIADDDQTQSPTPGPAPEPSYRLYVPLVKHAN